MVPSEDAGPSLAVPDEAAGDPLKGPRGDIKL